VSIAPPAHRICAPDPVVDPLNAGGFASFWSGGFEGADHVNGDGIALDLNFLTGHAAQLRGDYRRARAAGMRTVRESVGWRVCTRGARYDFSRALAMAREAARQGVEIAWTLWHYGFPRDVDPFSPSLPERFAEFAAAFARTLQPVLPARPWVNPVNEISFLTWLLTETSAIHPFRGDLRERAHDLKRNLAHAAVAACAAITERIPGARYFHTDPLIHVAAPDGSGELAALAQRETDAQFEAWSLLDSPDFVSAVPVSARFHLIGANYYHSSQWEAGTRRPLHWHLRDPRRASLPTLLRALRARFARPVVISETSHVGSGRAEWIRTLADELVQAADAGCAGVCLYPLVDRPDWDAPAHWHCSGLWDAVPCTHAVGVRRVKNRAAFAALRAARQRLAGPVASASLHNISPTCAATTAPKGPAMNALLVFSHLRWDFVYQRPQHVLSRIARRWPVVFVEEPLRHDGPTRVETLEVAPGVTLVRFHTPIAAGGFHDDQLAEIGPLLPGVLRDLGVDSYGAWFYTPMALPLLRQLTPATICYDCMDELAAFRNSPKQLLQRETALLRIANVVFTGGPSLYRSKRHGNDNVHCLPSSVEAAHFARGQRADAALPELAALPSPRLGFYGVVDERFDAQLLTAVADLAPQWQWCVVGPVVKIDPASLPQRPNIHYFGQRPYEHLPGALAAWDVALLPFARNESTRFISPTKTLEYLAAGKPVVTTPIADVVELYGSVVRVAEDAAAFVRECAAALAEDEDARAQRAAAGHALVAQTSWDSVVAHMIAEIEKVLPEGLEKEVAQLFGERDAKHATRRPPQDADVLVIGAGPTGLSAAYHLGARATLLEANATVGGWCRSIVDNGFTFDHAGHIMFSNSAVVLDLYQKLLGENVLWQDREAWIYSHGAYTRYPFQGALYGLPPKVMTECIMGAIEARYGAAAARTAANAPQEDCCGDGTAIDGACDIAARPDRPPANFEEFIYRTWGRGIAKHFAIPYNRKLWTVPLAEMETSWLGGRVPLPDLEQMIEGALSPVPRPMGPNARFGYPLRGGFQALMNGFLPLLQGPLHLEARVLRVQPSRRMVELTDGRTFRYEHLVSTMALPDLVAAIGLEAPAAVRNAAARLRRVSVRCVNLGIGRERVTDKHWIYYPEDTVFHRIFVQGNASPYCNPPGGFGITCEISYAEGKPLPCTGRALIDRCIADCIKVGMLREDDTILAANEVDLPYAYVLYDHARADAVKTIRQWLAGFDIHLAGRYSEWEYYNSDHAFLAGKRAADDILAAGAAAEARKVAARTA